MPQSPAAPVIASRPGTSHGYKKSPKNYNMHRKTTSFQPAMKGKVKSPAAKDTRVSSRGGQTEESAKEIRQKKTSAAGLTVSSKPAHKRQASGRHLKTLTEKCTNTQSRQPLFQAVPTRSKQETTTELRIGKA